MVLPFVLLPWNCTCVLSPVCPSNRRFESRFETIEALKTNRLPNGFDSWWNDWTLENLIEVWDDLLRIIQRQPHFHDLEEYNVTLSQKWWENVSKAPILWVPIRKTQRAVSEILSRASRDPRCLTRLTRPARQLSPASLAISILVRLRISPCVASRLQKNKTVIQSNKQQKLLFVKTDHTKVKRETDFNFNFNFTLFCTQHDSEVTIIT